MNLEKAIQHALDGNAILFLGAGFSFGGKNCLGDEIKVGKDLSYAMCDDLGISRSDNLTITATRYLEDERCKKGLKELITFLKGELTCIETTDEQDSIIKLPWKRIYTTNYDNIVEVSSEKSNIKRTSITITNRRYKASQNLEQAIVHINGYINKLNETNFYDEFKITDDNYNKQGLLQSTWKNLFETDLKRENAIIFIGYSLKYDQELVKYIANLDIKEKCFFIDIEKLSDDEQFKISRYGSLYLGGVQGFSEVINKVCKEYTPSLQITELKGFEKKELDSFYTEEHYSGIDVIDLLVKGKFQEKYINQPGYCIHRKEAIDEIEKEIPDRKVIILQSKLGNGKTVFLKCLCNKLLTEYNVYWLNNIDNYVEDLQLILKDSHRKNIIMIDDYGYYIQFIKEIGKEFPDNLCLVMTCRTAININLYYDLVERYGYQEDDIHLCTLDEMSKQDISDLIKVFNINRLWGEFDTLSFEQKKRTIIKKYSKNLSKVFYLLLDSKVIKSQIEKVLDVLNEKSGLRSFVTIQSINVICNLKLSYNDICTFSGVSNDLLHNYEMDNDVKELLIFEKNKFVLASSIYSQYLVRNVSERMEMIETLQKLYMECSQNDAWINKYKQQRKMLISRSNVKLIFSTKKQLTVNEEKGIFDYFDNIKNMETATDNPFFWLQFGITALNLERFDLAKIYFSNSYSNADQLTDFDTYQIDTHYARYLLQSEMKTNQNSNLQAMEKFVEAHNLLKKSSESGTDLSYILRQANLYYKYFVQYEELWSENEKNKFLDMAFQLVDIFLKYFKLKKLFKIPYDVSLSYLEYRKIFINTPYILQIKKCDDLYDVKVPQKTLRVRR